jgi:hypothetical protein
MDSWLSTIESDTRDVPLSQKVLDGKPATATDECFIGPAPTETTDRADYSVTFTAAQWTSLQQAFPDGVCDWTKPPVGYQPSIPWLTFGGGPGGEPVGPPPVSHTGPAKQ